MSARTSLPKITLVTPSLNQATFIGACIESVLSQNYPKLEYIIIDGGSTDGSAEIIRKFQRHLVYWTTEPDAGHYDAVNKGFRRATGDVLAWLNSDDMHTPWTLAVVGDIFRALRHVDWISTLYPLLWNASNLLVGCERLPGFTPSRVLRRDLDIQQESTFWRRSLWDRAGGDLDTSFALAADLELWARFWRLADLYGVPVPLAGFRRHGDQRSIRLRAEYLAEAATIRERYADLLPTRAIVAARAAQKLLPRRIRRVLGRAGIPYRLGAHRLKIIRQRDSMWHTEESMAW